MGHHGHLLVASGRDLMSSHDLKHNLMDLSRHRAHHASPSPGQQAAGARHPCNAYRRAGGGMGLGGKVPGGGAGGGGRGKCIPRTEALREGEALSGDPEPKPKGAPSSSSDEVMSRLAASGGGRVCPARRSGSSSEYPGSSTPSGSATSRPGLSGESGVGGRGGGGGEVRLRDPPLLKWRYAVEPEDRCDAPGLSPLAGSSLNASSSSPGQGGRTGGGGGAPNSTAIDRDVGRLEACGAGLWAGWGGRVGLSSVLV